MANRRQFIKCGLTFSTLPLAGLSSYNMAVAAPQGEEIFTLESFVADKRYSESVATAQSLKAQGVPIAEISGDMTELWVSQYAKQWKQQPMTLAGVTGSDALFVLETLAPEYGMRLIHKAVIYKSQLTQAEALPGHGNVDLVSWIIVPKTIAQALV